jgi:hypothetical protein
VWTPGGVEAVVPQKNGLDEEWTQDEFIKFLYL